MKGDPLVSIRCTVYNHEPYLRQCLDGFVMQKTTFPFEAIVHDDASTDGSAAIIREYAEKYPDIIKPIYESENQFTKGTIFKIMDGAMSPNSKYISLCEGDDYWTDPYKLQMQVEFLEKHPDYMMCFHRAITILDENGEETDRFPSESFKSIQDRDYTSTELLQVWTVPTASIVHRRECRYFPLKFKYSFVFGDIILVLTCAEMGKVRGFARMMSAYRIHKNSIIHNPQNEQRIVMRLPEHFLFIKDNFSVDKKVINYLISKRFWVRSQFQSRLVPKLTDYLNAFRYDFRLSFYRLLESKSPFLLHLLRMYKRKLRLG